MIDPSTMDPPAPRLLGEKLLALAALARCGFSIEVNQHRQFYETAAQHLEHREAAGGALPLDPSIRSRMIELDSIVAIQAYPRTPISFWLTLHFDLSAAIDEALAGLKSYPQYAAPAPPSTPPASP